MADRKNSAEIDGAETCYQVLALLAGARGIATEIADLAGDRVSSKSMINLDRLLGEAIDRLEKLAEAEGSRTHTSA